MKVVHVESIVNSLVDFGQSHECYKVKSLPERATLVILFCFILREVKGYEDKMGLFVN